jgi:hypothetical protein
MQSAGVAMRVYLRCIGIEAEDLASHDESKLARDAGSTIGRGDVDGAVVVARLVGVESFGTNACNRVRTHHQPGFDST